MTANSLELGSSLQSVLFTLFPTTALTSLGWPRKDRSDWPSLSGDVPGVFPTLACSMSAQSRAWPFSFDLPKCVPQTHGGLEHGKCLHHIREKDVNGNICLPGLWKSVATLLTEFPPRPLIPMGTGALSGCPDSSLFLCSSPRPQWAISYSNLMQESITQCPFRLFPIFLCTPKGSGLLMYFLSKFN